MPCWATEVETEKEPFGSSRAPLSPGLKVGRTIFVSGQVPRTPDGEVIAGGVAAMNEV